MSYIRNQGFSNLILIVLEFSGNVKHFLKNDQKSGLSKIACVIFKTAKRKTKIKTKAKQGLASQDKS